jgi:hypothetical protein
MELADDKREARVVEAKHVLGEIARAEKHLDLLRARLVELDSGAEPRTFDPLTGDSYKSKR